MRPTLATFSSKQWLTRQFRDPYVRARLSNPAQYRSRAAFKLLELNEAHHKFLEQPHVRAIVDLGAAPGGWSQVAAAKLGWAGNIDDETPRKNISKGIGYGIDQDKKLKSSGSWSDAEEDDELTSYDPLADPTVKAPPGHGLVVSIDLLHMQYIRGVQALRLDFLSPQADLALRGLLEDPKNNPDGRADVVLCDMAGNSSGNNIHDTEMSLEICHAAYAFIKRNLRTAREIGTHRGGVLVIKHFTHPLLQTFRTQNLDPHFNEVRYVKPSSSRAESREGYWVCQGWNGDERQL